eukprot:m.121702 g.121702  ORF g.121702 m.121702 type:complete len:480 (+) comp14584_c0_seq2:3774-5213(+)
MRRSLLPLLVLVAVAAAVQNPKLFTREGNLIIGVPDGLSVQVVGLDAQGNMVGAPDRVVTQSQLDAVVANFTNSLAQMRAQLLQINATSATGVHLASETSRAMRAEQTVSDAVASEAVRARAAEAAEASRAITAEASLANITTSLSSQLPLIGARVDGVSAQTVALGNSVATERTRLNATINELSRAQVSQALLNLTLTSLATQQATFSSSVGAQLVNLTQVDLSLASNITLFASDASTNTLSTARALNTSLLTSFSAGLSDLGSRVTCTLTPTVTDGSAAICAGYLSGRTCLPVCNQGFRLLSSSLFCNSGSWTGSAVCTGCTTISNCLSFNCTTAGDTLCLACAPGFVRNGNTCVVSARYWRISLTQVTASHFPRVSRYILSRVGTGEFITIKTFSGVSDNCVDNGQIDGVGIAATYDAGSATAIAAGGFYTVFSGVRGGWVVLEYSYDGTTWAALASRNIQTSACGVYLTDGTRPA